MSSASFGIASPANGGIGKSVVVKGNVLSEEDLIVDGQVEGTIDIFEHRLTITKNGTVRANVKAREVEIWGCLDGKVEAADRVYIRKGANFVGDIHSGGIVIEEGGYMRGNIDLSRNPALGTGDAANPTNSAHNPSQSEPIRQLSRAVLTS